MAVQPRYFFIGDIHGCADELLDLLKKINPRRGDRIISVGDIVNKGPDSNRAVQLMLEYGVEAVLGNHDRLVKLALRHPDSPDHKKKHLKLLHQLTPEHQEWIVNLPLFRHYDDIQTSVIHAGLKPYVPIEEQDEVMITNIRVVDPVSKAYVKRDQPGIPWYFYYDDSRRIIYGHHACRSIKVHKSTIGIDTGCLYGHKLTAYVLPDNRFISVPARDVYVDYTQGGKFTMPR